MNKIRHKNKKRIDFRLLLCYNSVLYSCKLKLLNDFDFRKSLIIFPLIIYFSKSSLRRVRGLLFGFLRETRGASRKNACFNAANII